MSTKKLVKEIEFELQEIRALLDLYREELFELNREPNLVELTALAGVLHSFYCGIERVFLIIAKKIDQKIPQGLNWHKTLLLQMTQENSRRKAVLSDKTKDELSEYLIFRHFYRHAYATYLKWQEMKGLVTSIYQTWQTFSTEVAVFLKTFEDC